MKPGYLVSCLFRGPLTGNVVEIQFGHWLYATVFLFVHCMKRIIISICMISLWLFSQGQTESPVGEYWLQGEAETAAGFKLDSNGQFQFFFSYGALDRQAKGTWQKEGDRILLSSEPKGVQDFQLTGSKQSRAKQVTIFLSGPPPEMMHYFAGTGVLGGKQFSGTADKQGRIALPVNHLDSVLLWFDWCPEKTFHYAVAAPSHNRFFFRLLPSITDVVFDNHAFIINAEGLTGTLPFSGEHSFSFRRTISNERNP